MGLVTVIVIFLQKLFHQTLGKAQIQRCHEVSANYLSIVGTIYAVVLGLIVFEAMSTFNDATLTVKDEAKSLLAIYMLAEQTPAKEAPVIKELVRSYVSEVLDREWPLLAEGRKSLIARKIALDIISTAKRINPVTENQKGVFPVLLQESISMWENRRERTDESDRGIPNVEWIILLFGACTTVFLTFFFSMDSHRVQYVMTALVTLIIAVNLYLVLLFGSPYSGDLMVSNDPYLMILSYIKENP